MRPNVVGTKIDKTNVPRLQFGRGPFVTFDFVAGVAAVIKIVEIAGKFWEKILRTEVIEFEVVEPGGVDFFQ